MKRIQFLCIAAVLLLTGTASADLVVQDYLDNGEKVTLDTVTGNYWYWNLADFVDMTYDEQMSAIAGLGTYGNIAGGWHMATLDEMEALWAQGADEIRSGFFPTGISPSQYVYIGRYDLIHSAGQHYYVYAQAVVGGPAMIATLPHFGVPDAITVHILGAWVTTDAAVVPAPGALVLAATGLLSVLGVNRWCRKS